MAWNIIKRGGSPMQRTLTVANDLADATPTTAYHAADGIARREFGSYSLIASGYSLTGRAVRTYASQAY